jgi:hypothetical protein
MASIKDAEQNGEHSESRREREEHHIPEVWVFLFWKILV